MAAPQVEQREPGRIVQLILGLVVTAGVIAFGAVHPATYLSVNIGVVLLAGLVLWKSGWPRLPLTANIVLGAMLAVPALQLVPLPAGVLGWLSPARASLHRDLVVPFLPGATTAALSVDVHATSLALLKLAACAVMFVVAFQISRSDDRPLLLPVLLAIGFLEATYGLYQYLTASTYILNRAINSLPVAHGTYINRNNYAGLLAMIVPFIAARIAGELSRRHGRRSSRFGASDTDSSGLWMLWLVLFLLLFLGILFSQSRGGIIAAVLGAMTALFAVLARGSRRASAVILLVVFGAPLLYGAWIGLDPIVQRFEAIKPQPGTGLSDDRLLIWKDTTALIRDYPWFGTGLGTYSSASLHYQSSMLDFRYEHAHNDYLEFASEIGIPVTVLLFGALWALVFRVARRALVTASPRQRALTAGCAGSITAVLVHSLTDFDLQMPASALLFAWVVGLAAQLSARENAKDSVRLFSASA